MKKNEEIALSAMLSPKSNESSVDYVISSIKELLLTEKLNPGDRLPAEMELSKMLSVSRGSIREAMKILAAFGIIEIKRGDGTYITQEFEGKILFDPLLFSFILSRPDFEELKELRLILEKDVVCMVIKNATIQDVEILRECHASLELLREKDGTNHEDLLKYDLEFHYTLGKLTKNRLLEKIYHFMMEYFKPYIARSIKNNTYFSLESKEAHRKILDAIITKDLPLANQAVENSINVWETLIFKEA